MFYKNNKILNAEGIFEFYYLTYLRRLPPTICGEGDNTLGSSLLQYPSLKFKYNK